MTQEYKNTDEYMHLVQSMEETLDRYIENDATWDELEAAEQALQAFIDANQQLQDAADYCGECCCGRCKHAVN